MAEKSSYCLAPFGGITRIRFKGFVQDVSANSAPPLFPESKKDEVRSKREILGDRNVETGYRKVIAGGRDHRSRLQVDALRFRVGAGERAVHGRGGGRRRPGWRRSDVRNEGRVRHGHDFIRLQ